MPPQMKSAITGEFQRGVNELRSKIELLPAGQQPEFRQLVDQPKEKCGQLQRTCATLQDAVGDLRLATKCAEFNMEATVREIQEARRRSGLRQ